MANNILFEILSMDQTRVIHETTLDILENIGVKVHNEEALLLLDGAGAHINSNVAKIPSFLVEKAVATAPKDIKLYDQKGNVSMLLDTKNTYFGSNTDCFKYIDPYSGKSIKLASTHSRALARIGDYLPNISFVYFVGLLSDYDARLGSRIAYKIALMNTTKTINFTTSDSDSCADIIELSSLIAGGKDKLRSKPFIFHYCEPIPPLMHDDESVKKVLYCAAAGVPVVYMPYCLMGATAPVTLAGALAQSNAEILSGLVIHQAKAEGAPFIIGAMPSTIDMKTTVGTYGSPELHLQIAASSELAHYYGLPFYGTAGCSDAKTLDYQTVSEATMSLFTALLSKANVVHDLGFMDHANMVSPELVVLSDEILNMLNVVSSGIKVNKNTLAFDVIKQVGPGGHYLAHEHTLQNFKKIWYSEFMDRSMDKNAATLNEKINLRTKEIIENHIPEPISEDRLSLLEEAELIWNKNLL